MMRAWAKANGMKAKQSCSRIAGSDVADSTHLTVQKRLEKSRPKGAQSSQIEKRLKTPAIPEALPAEFKDHKLKGEWREFRECHIEPDWLLIYSITDFELRPARVGSHAELFE